MRPPRSELENPRPLLARPGAAETAHNYRVITAYIPIDSAIRVAPYHMLYTYVHWMVDSGVGVLMLGRARQ